MIGQKPKKNFVALLIPAFLTLFYKLCLLQHIWFCSEVIHKIVKVTLMKVHVYLNLVIRLLEQGATGKFHKERLLILKGYCTIYGCINQFIEYNVEPNVASLIEKLFVKAPSIYQYLICNYHKCRQFIPNTILMPVNQNKLLSGTYICILKNNNYFK